MAVRMRKTLKKKIKNFTERELSVKYEILRREVEEEEKRYNNSASNLNYLNNNNILPSNNNNINSNNNSNLNSDSISNSNSPNLDINNNNNNNNLNSNPNTSNQDLNNSTASRSTEQQASHEQLTYNYFLLPLQLKRQRSSITIGAYLSEALQAAATTTTTSPPSSPPPALLTTSGDKSTTSTVSAATIPPTRRSTLSVSDSNIRLPRATVSEKSKRSSLVTIGLHPSLVRLDPRSLNSSTTLNNSISSLDISTDSTASNTESASFAHHRRSQGM